jgi:hypothetical protein
MTASLPGSLPAIARVFVDEWNSWSREITSLRTKIREYDQILDKAEAKGQDASDTIVAIWRDRYADDLDNAMLEKRVEPDRYVARQAFRLPEAPLATHPEHFDSERFLWRLVDWIVRTWAPAWISEMATSEKFRDHSCFARDVRLCEDIVDYQTFVDVIPEILLLHQDASEQAEADDNSVAFDAMSASGWDAFQAADTECVIDSTADIILGMLFDAVNCATIASGRTGRDDFDGLRLRLRDSAAELLCSACVAAPVEADEPAIVLHVATA